MGHAQRATDVYLTLAAHRKCVLEGIEARNKWNECPTEPVAIPYDNNTLEMSAWIDGFRLHGETIDELAAIVWRVAERRGAI
jgi:hypothetical protein